MADRGTPQSPRKGPEQPGTSTPRTDRQLLDELHSQMAEISGQLEKAYIHDYVRLMNSPRKLIWTNLIGGIARGVGIAIGVTIFTTFILYALKGLGALNLPIIGGFIADLIEHVQQQIDIRRY